MSGTIYALASGAGRAGVAVIRISGPDAGDALLLLTGKPLPAARRAQRVTLTKPGTGEALDDGLALRFPAPRSYTGDDVVELHVHGGMGVIAAVLDALGGIRGLRLAEPGEFTRRAVLAGKMDLTAAEGLLDLIEADTDAQRRQALRQSGGALGRLYDGWRSRLIAALAHLEAAIDFPDEELPENLIRAFRGDIAALEAEMALHLADGRRGERLRQGLMVAIVGPPNAGKSSLLNLLARRDAAIVSARAGTTRDVVEAWLDLAGFPVLVADTAGLREAADEIEAEGVRRARQWAGTADLKIAVFAADETPAGGLDMVDADTLVVVNKVDLGKSRWKREFRGIGVFEMSLKSGEGVDAFLNALSGVVRDRIGAATGSAPVLTRARHRDAVIVCREALARSLAAALPELAAEDLRLAARALGRITGAVDVEELLDVIFRDFCIGK
ncbi:MAG: tRNA uridine-5-carboxymethylaminomethyl(34) synthesis GTPase MnmE [Alphaproteobacteria bacterium]|nr:tRNA uridine-5-carboxymethylaminomethyl(34) synthesis GTPase MnmE [Alphaproteobacteria bacterium]